MTLVTTPARPAAPGSDRVRLATLALETACGIAAVLGGEAGPSGVLVTVGAGGQRLNGVQAVAEPDGRYAIALGLRTALVPLGPLADEIRARVVQAAGATGLGDQLGAIDVSFLALGQGPP